MEATGLSSSTAAASPPPSPPTAVSSHDDGTRKPLLSPAPTSTASSPAATPFQSVGDLASTWTPASAFDVLTPDSERHSDKPADAPSEGRHSPPTMTPVSVADAGAGAGAGSHTGSAASGLDMTLSLPSSQPPTSKNHQPASDSPAGTEADAQRPSQQHPAVSDGDGDATALRGPEAASPTRGQHEPPPHAPPLLPHTTQAHAQLPIRDAVYAHISPDHEPRLSPPPLRHGSVDHDTLIVHPTPLIKTTSDISRRNIKHPVPDLNTHSGSYVGNIAQLEATAERLSMTSSIDDAIRDLHCELKRSDSRRSSILAASVRGLSAEDSAVAPPPTLGQLTRHRSNSSSIVATNSAARHGGYSPAAFVMSPANSLTGRLRSGSKNSSGRPDIDLEPALSRQGPGKASIRSVRSTKMSLAEISESEPISLTQTALDDADAAPPIELTEDDMALQYAQADANLDPDEATPRQEVNEPHMSGPHAAKANTQNEDTRPSSARSNATFHQAQDAFHDFDGVHCEPDHDDESNYGDEPDHGHAQNRGHVHAHAHAHSVGHILDHAAALPMMEQQHRPHSYMPPAMARPQSYMDPETGQQMLYYPARVPAMLNLPPKLSNKPKTGQRDQRRSEILSAMMDHRNSQAYFKRQSGLPDLDMQAPMADSKRDSFLPDPLAGHRNSFAALSSYDPLHAEIGDSQSVRDENPVAEAETNPEPAPVLRRPQRLTEIDAEHRKSRMSRLDNLPPQLRASAYFDLPSESPQVEVKDGSAMATLDSILDASANAPVSAFTDHSYAGKLGSEIYGKEKKRKSQAPAVTLQPTAPDHKKRTGSFMWLGKRSASHTSDEKKNLTDGSGLGLRNDETRYAESQALASSIDGESVVRHQRHDDSASDYEDRKPGEEDDDDAQSDNDVYQGPPTTLLAELHLRKQQQKQRTAPLSKAFPNGMHATLLEMDAVAETQRKHRKGKRVNLAWEDPDANMNGDESDDDDVPLAIIAAKSQGANNMIDVDRPLGLMERREMEENEPLSHRRARLQGQDPSMLPQRPSMMNLTAPMMVGGPQSPGSRPGTMPEPEEQEFEGETLGERKRRLAAKEEAESRLPKARPVSSSFSAELLSQFGDLDEDKIKSKENKAPNPDAEEETLGQRRRRLQAEREARQREMSYGQLTSDQPAKLNHRLSMADMLNAHPKKAMEPATDGRHGEEQRLVREQEAKMAAMRKQMPTSLKGPTLERAGGFQGGAFNDGNAGGQGLHTMRSQPNLNPHHMAPPHLQHRASTVFSTYGMPAQQPMYGGHNGVMGYNAGNPYNPYNGGAVNMYNAGRMQPGMQMPMAMNTGPIDRVEQWRQGVWQ